MRHDMHPHLREDSLHAPFPRREARAQKRQEMPRIDSKQRFEPMGRLGHDHVRIGIEFHQMTEQGFRHERHIACHEQGAFGLQGFEPGSQTFERTASGKTIVHQARFWKGKAPRRIADDDDRVANPTQQSMRPNGQSLTAQRQERLVLTHAATLSSGEEDGSAAGLPMIARQPLPPDLLVRECHTLADLSLFAHGDRTVTNSLARFETKANTIPSREVDDLGGHAMAAANRLLDIQQGSRRNNDPLLSWLLAVLLLALPVSCQQHAKPSVNAEIPITAEVGEGLYALKNCASCHTISGRGGKIGCELTRVAMRRKKDWMIRWLRDPQAVRPGATMPNMHLKDSEARAIAEYLGTRK